MQESKNKKKKIIVSILIVCGIAAAAVLVLHCTDDQGEEWTGIPVETPYGTLYVSDEWSECLDIEIRDESDYSVIFSGKYDKFETELFSLTFSKNKTDTILGQFKDGTYVCLQMFSLEMPDSVPEEKQNAFYAMQEEINALNEQLQQMEEFTPAN